MFTNIWYIFLALSMLVMLRGKGIKSIERTLCLQQVIAVTFPTITSLIMLFMGMYGPVDDRQQVECWVKKPKYQLFYYTFVIISILLDIVLLCYTVIVLKGLPSSIRGLLRRVMMFVMCDLVVYTIPVISRAYGIVEGEKPPFALGAAHNIMLASLGLMNGIIWGTMATFEPLRLKDLRFRLLGTMIWPSRRHICSSETNDLEVSFVSSDPTPKMSTGSLQVRRSLETDCKHGER